MNNKKRISTAVIDGRKIANELKKRMKERVKKLNKRGVVPKLGMILVGKDPASEIYVKMKQKVGREVGIETELHTFPKNFEEKRLVDFIRRLNKRKDVHAIIVQLPLPPHIDEYLVLNAISPEKDADGMCSTNMGNLLLNREFLVPCTPKGIIRMLEHGGIDFVGKAVVIIGRSILFGKPLALMLMNRHSTVTVCHSKTKNLKELTKQADILVVGVGKPKFVTKDMVKTGAVVIDVGINHVGDKICGDVDFENMNGVVSSITPVPGGVGPMTVAMVLENTLIAAETQCLL